MNGRWELVVSRRARASQLASLLVFVLAVGVTGITHSDSAGAAAVGDEPVMTMYVPLAEQEISDGLFSIYPAGAPTAADVVSTITITAAADDSLIYWDHWEDGFEDELSAPTSASTQVWGDEDLSNGAAPGVAVAADDVVDVGTVIFLQNTVSLPRSATEIFFDGGDKVASSRGFSMSRAGWDSAIGAAHAGAVAATDTSRFGSRFDVPIGEDAGFGAFDYTGLSVQVAADTTTIDVDFGGDGTVDRTVVRDEGQTLFIDGGITVGTVVTTSSPAQVHLITGRVDSRYEGRWFEVFPAETLADEYVAAAGSFSATQLVTIFLYNPNDAPIEIASTTNSGTSVVSLAAGDVAAVDLPNGSGGRFASPGNEFSALSGTVARTGTTAAYDWGYSLVPSSLLTPTVFVGWGAGNPGNTASNSPVWVAPLADTTIYVDSDVDGVIDQSIPATAFESVRVVDPDHDLTGARIYTTDGTLLSVAWGQDAALQASNAYDLGTAILPTASLITSKSAELTGDVNGDGLVDPGDELTYSIQLFDAGAQSITGLNLTDDLAATLAYVAGSTSADGSPIPDATTGTPNPLDESGTALADLAPGGSSVVTFRATVVADLPFGTDSVENTVAITAQQTSTSSTVITPVTPIFPATIEGGVWFDLDGDGTPGSTEPRPDGVTVSIRGPSHPAGTSATTTAGAYSFGDLAPGVYTVTVDRSVTSPLPAAAYSTTGGDSRQVTIASGETLDANDFGYVVPASISGSVFDDSDADGTLDSGEPVFAGVLVTLVGPGLPPSGVTRVTNADGSFLFAGLSDGAFTITAAAATGDLPAHYVRTTSAVPVTITAQQHSTGNDVGFYNPIPEAVDDRYSAETEAVLRISDASLGVLANDQPGNAPLTVTSVDVATTAGGTIDIAPDGTFTYTPPTGFVGVDTFDYTVTDASGDQSTARVTITVASTAMVGGIVWHDRNADGQIDADERPIVDIAVQRTGCAGGSTETVRSDRTGRYSFDAVVPGCHQIDVAASPLPSDPATPTFDRDGGFDASAAVDVAGGADVIDADFGFVNLVPDAVADDVDTDEGVAVTFDPLANDSDPEGRALTITFVATTAGGTATTDGTTVTYTPAPGFDGTETVVYTVCDPAGQCSTATATVIVRNTNDPPRLRSGTTEIEITIGRSIPRLDVVDVEGDGFTVTLVGGQLPSGVTLEADGSFDGIPTASTTSVGSTITFDVELCDSRGACQTITMTMRTVAATAQNNIPTSGTNSGGILLSALGTLLLGLGLSTWSRRPTSDSVGQS